MPDFRKLAVGLTLTNSNDSMVIASNGFANIENYLNWLAAPHALTTANTSLAVDLWPYTSGFTNASPVYALSGAVFLSSGHIAQFTPAIKFFGLAIFDFSVTASDGFKMTNSVVICVTPLGAPVIPPQFSSVAASGANMVFRGSNGVPSGNYFLLGSTNLTSPMSHWTRLLTNQFDAAGNFHFTNALNANARQNFYILEVP